MKIYAHNSFGNPNIPLETAGNEIDVIFSTSQVLKLFSMQLLSYPGSISPFFQTGPTQWITYLLYIFPAPVYAT